MKILIINLALSTDRLKFQQEQLTSLGLAFERLEATSTTSLKKPADNQLLGWERPLRLVELACYLSHKSAWERVCEVNEPVLILEDDALLSKHCKKVLKSLENRSDADLITLEIRSRKKIISREGEELSLTHKLYKLFQDRTGAAGYILWPSGAKKLLEKANVSSPALADAFISSCYSLSAFQVEPAVIIQLDQCSSYDMVNKHSTHSTISSHNKPSTKQLGIFLVFLFRLKRIKSQLKMGLRQLSVIFSGEKRHIKLVKKHFT